jgi:hypothetical protein
MSKLKIFLSIPPTIKNFKTHGRIMKKFVRRTDHYFVTRTPFIGQYGETYFVHDVYNKYIHRDIGNRWTFSEEQTTREWAVRKVTTFDKNRNLMMRLNPHYANRNYL